jgi:pimeloyl-ACP methyl ester carboxylesterase
VPAPVVLVHGAWHGAWAWERVTTLLAGAGVPTVAVDLPSAASPPGDLHADVAAIRGALDTLGASVVLCAHSYGGAPVTEAAAGHPAVAHLVYVSAFALEAGESVMHSVEPEADDGPEAVLGAAFRPRDDGTIALDPEGAVAAFYSDCEPEDAAWARARLRPQSAASFRQTVSAAAWHDIPSTYAVCTRDRGVASGLQRALAHRASQVVEWPTGHSPHLSRPELVVGLLAARALIVEQ